MPKGIFAFSSAVDKLGDTLVAFFMSSLKAYLGKVEEESAPSKPPAEVAQPVKVVAPQKSDAQVRQEAIGKFEGSLKREVDIRVEKLELAQEQLSTVQENTQPYEKKRDEINQRSAELSKKEEAILGAKNEIQSLEVELKGLREELLQVQDRSYVQTVKKEAERKLRDLTPSVPEHLNKTMEKLLKGDVDKAFSENNVQRTPALKAFREYNNPRQRQQARIKEIQEKIGVQEAGLSSKRKNLKNLREQEIVDERAKLEKERALNYRVLKELPGALKEANQEIEQAEAELKAPKFAPSHLTAYINNLAAEGRVHKDSVVDDVLGVLTVAVPKLNAEGARTRLEAHVKAHAAELKFPDLLIATVNGLYQDLFSSD